MIPTRLRRTSARVLPISLALAACVVAAGGVLARADAKRTPPSVAVEPTRSDEQIRDLDIAFYAERAARDPSGASDLARLAGLYLQRARESGDPRDAAEAERAARRSLKNRREHNDQAAQVLASALLAEHQFVEALSVARDLHRRNPESPSLLATVAEIEMELGDYAAARRDFKMLDTVATDLSVAPRLARWAEIEGRSDDARRLSRRALAIARHEPSLPREQLAWFWLRAGDVDLRAGRFASADSAYRAALAAHPNDYRVLSAMCRSASMQRRWREAIDVGERGIALTLDPATLGLLSEAYDAIGDTAKASEYAHALDAAVSLQPGAYHRAWSLYLLDHRRNLPAVTRKIRNELTTRHDVYGYDILAWSDYVQHRPKQARAAMAKALSQGTKDALLFRHAALIARANGDSLDAASYVSRARTLNPFVDVGGEVR